MIEARVEDYLARYDVPAREQTDVRWAQTCMTLEDTVEQLGAQLSPVLVRRMQDKLAGAVFWLQLCRTVLAAAGEKPALAGC